MAVTKTHPIKTTLNKAIAYICNPGKTDETLLVSSFGCSAETADIEFSWTRRHAIDKGTNLGRHLIQAFSPGEVTPKQAHEIGMKLANEVLGGKYEFVLTTHIDKGHIHNHIIGLLRYAGHSLRLPVPEDSSVHPFGKPISHSTQSGFKAALSERGFSWKITWAARFPFFFFGS